MKYVITEEKLTNLIFNYLNDYIKDYPPKENKKGVISWGEEKENLMVYDKPDEILFVRRDFFESVQSMFSLTLRDTRGVFIDWLRTMGYRVKAFI